MPDSFPLHLVCSGLPEARNRGTVPRCLVKFPSQSVIFYILKFVFDDVLRIILLYETLINHYYLTH